MQLIVKLNEADRAPLYQQVVNGMRDLIVQGTLAPGTRLPSTRELAQTLSISRFTASKAYEELSRLGYIEASSSAGTFVCRTLPLQTNSVEALPHHPARPIAEPGRNLRLSDYGERIISSPSIEPADVELLAELNFCAPAPEQLPVAKW